MKKIVPGIGNRAKRYRKPNELLTGSGKKIKKRKSKRKRKNGRKRTKRKTKKR